MRDHETNFAANENRRKHPSLFARLNERAKRLNDVKVNALTVLIFFAGLGVLTAVATGIGYVMQKAVKGIERPLRH